ncbi:MAG: hypothetical protein AB7H43_11650 [Acidimicrobiia bacterium]
MSDDLESRLRDDLDRRAASVTSRPDAADLALRLTTRWQRRSRVLTTALVVMAVAGPLAGYRLASGREDGDLRALTAGDATVDDGSFSTDGEVPPSTAPPPVEGRPSYSTFGLDWYGGVVPVIAERTTKEGIRLVVRQTRPIPPDPAVDPRDAPCQPDGGVRVGVVADDLVGTTAQTTFPPSMAWSGAFGIVGAAEGRPAGVAIVRANAVRVEAVFPNGTIDGAPTAHGVAVLAAFADAGRPAASLVDDTVLLLGADAAQATALRSTDRSYPDCSLLLPLPGVQPADPVAARAAVTAAFATAYDGRLPSELRGPSFERFDIWQEANRRLEETGLFDERIATASATVDQVVFTAPDQATVRFTLVGTTLGTRLGRAVLVDGSWKVSIETYCDLVAASGVTCLPR